MTFLIQSKLHFIQFTYITTLNSPFANLSSKQQLPPHTQTSIFNMSPRRPHDPIMRAIQDLTIGHESALSLHQCLLNSDTKLQKQMISQLIETIITSFQNSISVIDSCGNGDDLHKSEEISIKSEDSREISNPTTGGHSVRKGRRGCYKRRKGSQSFTKIVPSLADDGRIWRKYGQKVILNAPFPRSYFRCTHKKDQGCLATKQVQRTQSEPPMYTVTYDGIYTCTDALKSASLFADSAPIPDSSILLSFNSFEPNTYNGCTIFGSDDYMISPELPPFEGISSISSSNCTDLDQGMEFMQHEVENFGMCTSELDDLMRLKFEF